MAKGAPSEDPRKRPAEKGRPDAARKETGKASPGDGIVQRAQERRQEAENLLAHREWNAAIPLLQSLAKLPHDSTRDTALWARQQIQRLQRRAEGAGGAEKAANVEVDRPAAPEPAASGAADAFTEEAVGENLLDRMGGTRGLVILSGVAAVLFWCSLALVVFLVQEPVAALQVEVAATARGQQIGLGIGRRHYAVDSLTEPIPVAPGLYDVSLTVDRVEMAALKLEVADDQTPRLRVVMERGQPRLQLTDDAGEVISQTELPKPAPVTEAAPAETPVASTGAPQESTRTKSPSPSPNPDPVKSEVAKTDSGKGVGKEPSVVAGDIPADDASSAEIAKWLFSRSTAGVNFQAKLKNPQGQMRNVAQVSQIPGEPFDIDSLMLPDNATLTAADFSRIAKVPGLRGLTLSGPHWKGDEIVAFRAHPTLEFFIVYGVPQAAVADIPEFRGFEILSEIPTLRSVMVDGRKVTDTDLTTLTRLPQLMTLSICVDALTPAGYGTLANFSTLRSLILRSIDPASNGIEDSHLDFLKSTPQLGQLTLLRCKALTGEGLRNVLQLPELRSVSIQDCPKFNDEGLKSLCAAAPNLMTIQIGAGSFGGPGSTSASTSSITNEGITALRPLKQLGGVTITSARGITDEGVGIFLSLPALRQLDLTAAGVTDAGATQLAQHRGLLTLILSRTQVGDAACAEFAKMPQLQMLNLDQSEVTDEGILKLGASKSLRRLNIVQTNTTREAVDELRKAAPMLEVYRP